MSWASKPSGGGFASSSLKIKSGRFGGFSFKTISSGFNLFRPQNCGVANWWTCGVISKSVSRQSEVYIEGARSIESAKRNLDGFTTGVYGLSVS